jgi:hypothetical protein
MFLLVIRIYKLIQGALAPPQPLPQVGGAFTLIVQDFSFSSDNNKIISKNFCYTDIPAPSTWRRGWGGAF